MARGMMDSKKKGMAMLTALLVVAIASALATSLWYGTALDMARMQNIQQAYQAKHLSQGLMLWASDVLKKDYEESDPPWDNNNDNWLQGIKQIPADGAIMSGGLVGLSDCFNVNNLWRNGDVSENHYQYFKRLLNLLSVDAAVAEQAIDWIDTDQISRPQGAEDFAYLASSPSYQTGSQPFWHESQLKLLQAVTPEIYDVIHPYVCVLPAQSTITKMNINTLPPIMIRALNPSISEALALSVYQDGSASFSQLNAFYEHSEMSIITSREGVKEQLADLLSVQTRYIQAEAEVLMESSVHDSYILLRRGGDGAAVALQRAQSPFRLLDAVE